MYTEAHTTSVTVAMYTCYLTTCLYKPDISPNSTWLVSTQLDMFDMSSQSKRACRAVLFRHGRWRTTYSAPLYIFMLINTKILFDPLNKTN